MENDQNTKLRGIIRDWQAFAKRMSDKLGCMAIDADIEDATDKLLQQPAVRDQVEIGHRMFEALAKEHKEQIICPYCQIEQETIGGFIAHPKLLHPAH